MALLRAVEGSEAPGVPGHLVIMLNDSVTSKCSSFLWSHFAGRALILAEGQAQSLPRR